jgi:hypothetical protein
MRHVRTSALCLVMLSCLAAGYPSASPAETTEGPTKIELLAARRQHNTSTSESTSTAAAITAAKRQNAELNYGVPASPAVGIHSICGVLNPLLLALDLTDV